MIPLILMLAVAGLMHAARSFTSEITASATPLAFGYLLLTSYFTGKLVERIGLPKLTGYIIAGVVSGPYVLDLVTAPMGGSLKVVSSAAMAIIALEAGAELHIASIRPTLRTLSALTVFAVIGSMVALSGALFAMRSYLPMFDAMGDGESLAVCVVLGVALSAQSPAVVMAMLAETRADGPLSSMVLATVVVADLAVIVCFSLASALATAVIGGAIDVGATILAVCWELFGSLVFGVAIGMLIGLFLRSVTKGASLFALLVCVVVGEIGVRVHLDPLLVMLAAGVWLRNFSRADASHLLHGFEAAQLPVFLVFFALAGAKLDLVSLGAALVPVLVLVAVRAGCFFAGGTFAGRLTRAPQVVTDLAWLGLVPQAGLALALALVLAKNFPGFGEYAAVLVVSVVGVNQLIGPVLLRIALIRGGETGKKATTDFAAHAPHTSHAPHAPHAPPPAR